MRNPRRLVILALATSVTMLSAACGSSTSGSSVLSSIKVDGNDAAKAPTVTVTKTPLNATTSESKVLKEGTGAALTGKDLTKVKAVIVNGTDGKVVGSTWDSAPTAIDLSQDALFAALKSQLPGKKIGSRVLIAAPPKDVFGKDGNTGAGLKGTDSVVFVIDIMSATQPLTEAKGSPVPAKADLPTVTVKDTKTPATITIPSGVSAPTSLVVQPLITGTGPEVQDGQTVRVTYTGALWKDGSVFDSSATSALKHFDFVVGQQGIISGWNKGIKGQKVGSRMLLVVPPSEGYGAAGQGTKISGTDTLVFVVDILAAL
ncbi:MAG TPA: FKBP-type peptidyl-prolyl cis-trans isomerase [Phycicoccus sp.]|nr:FKBP-type peptidyl-prolyl cis-trans isomerase [Phycicoccus sp.]